MRLCKIVFLLVCSGFYTKAQTGNSPQATLNILFVGNSLTYTNNLPEIVKELAKQDGIDIKYSSLSLPDHSLEDHWNEGKLQKQLDKEKYDFLIAQQGPSALPESQVLLLEYTKKIRELCDSRKTKLA